MYAKRIITAPDAKIWPNVITTANPCKILKRVSFCESVALFTAGIRTCLEKTVVDAIIRSNVVASQSLEKATMIVATPEVTNTNK